MPKSVISGSCPPFSAWTFRLLALGPFLGLAVGPFLGLALGPFSGPVSGLPAPEEKLSFDGSRLEAVAPAASLHAGALEQERQGGAACRREGEMVPRELGEEGGRVVVAGQGVHGLGQDRQGQAGLCGPRSRPTGASGWASRRLHPPSRPLRTAARRMEAPWGRRAGDRGRRSGRTRRTAARRPAPSRIRLSPGPPTPARSRTEARASSSSCTARSCRRTRRRRHCGGAPRRSNTWPMCQRGCRRWRRRWCG